MEADNSSDILMNMVLGSSPIEAEASASLSSSTLLKGFTPGRFFEIQSVDFGIARQGGTSIGPNQKAGTDMDAVTVSRRVDRASVTLLDCCFGAKTFASATIVKRRSAGTTFTGEPYLRVEFTGVLITNISWGDQEIVNENFSFICRAMSFTYRAQNASGDLAGDYNAAWTQVMSGATAT